MLMCKDCIISCTIFGNCNSNKFKVFILTCVATGFSKSSYCLNCTFRTQTLRQEVSAGYAPS